MIAYDLNRFLEKVNITEGCWEWVAGKSTRGYGVFGFEGKTHYAHRISYLWFVGCLDSKLTIEHECMNPACVNPDHLIQVSNAENQYLRHGANSIYCKNGHERHIHGLIDAAGKPRCRACLNIAQRVLRRTGHKRDFMRRALPQELEV